MSVGSFITKHLPGFPQGNPGELQAAASTWSNVAGSLRTLADDSNGRIASLSASWQGKGKDSFAQEWSKLVAAVHDGCDELTGIASALNQAADKIADAQRRYEVAAGAAAATAVVGIGLTVFTFGASDAVAAEATAVEVGAAVEVAAEAATVTETLLTAAVNIATQMVTRFVVFLGVDLTAQAGISAVVDPDHNPFGLIDLSSAVSVAGGMAMPDIPGGVAARIGAGAALGAGQDTLTQLLTTGKVDPGAVLFNGVLGGAGGAVGAGLDSAVGRLGEAGILSRAPEDVLPVADPVDVATGDVILSQVDLTLPGTLPLVLERRHRSGWQAGRWFGASWVSSFDQRLEVSETGVRGLFSDGRILTWPVPSDDQTPLLPVSGAAWPLRRLPDSGYTVTDPKRGLTWRFGEHSARPADASTSSGDLVELPLHEVQHRGGQSIGFRYDEDGCPQGITHSGGYRAAVNVEAGHVTSLALHAPDGDITITRYEYDERGRLSGVINSSGLPLRFSYDDAGRLVGWLDRNGQSYRYAYDTLGRCMRGEGPGGALSGRFSYDEQALTTRWTNVSGAVTTYALTPNRRVAAVTDPLNHVTSWEHDDRGRVTTRTDQLGRVTRYVYDQADNVIAVTRPDGAQALASYEQSRPVVLTEPDGARWRQDYDERGNRTALIAPDGAVTQFSYDARGHLAGITDAEGAVTQVSCDTAGLPVAVTRSGDGRTSCARDSFGRITELTGPDGGLTALTWTIEGSLTARALPDGASEAWSYDGEGNLTAHRDAAGGRTRYEYGPFDVLTSLTRPDGTRSDFAYDHELRPVGITHAGLTWRYEYDAAGRLVSETDYNHATTSYSYDPAGQLTARVSAGDQRVVFGYDQTGNLTERATDDGLTAYGYDLVGRVVSARNGDADIRLERDAVGRVTAESCNGRELRSSYDLAGRVTSRATPSGAMTHWAYGPAGRPAIMTAAGHEIGFGYDPAGRETRRDLPGGLTLTQDWDQRGRLSSQSLSAIGTPLPEGPAVPGQPGIGRLLQRRRYSYRPDGFIVGIDDLLVGYRAIDLDPSGRVTSVTGHDWAEEYAYDRVGNVTAATWPVTAAPASAAAAPDGNWLDPDAQGQREFSGTLIRRAGNVHYQHDEQGRVVQRQRTRISRKPATWRYEWNADNRLTSVVTPCGVVWRYLYDPFGRRVAKQRLAADGNVAEQTDFTWDGVLLVEQSVHSVASGRESIVTWNYRPDSFAPLTQAEYTSARDAPQERVDERFYAIITDLIGTPAELTNPDGTLAGHQRETLWGGTTWDSRGATSPLRFPGQYEDPETGLYYNNQRYYDPTSGTYLSPDPLGLTPSPNPHAYVPSPHVLADPLGLMSCGPGLEDDAGAAAKMFSSGDPHVGDAANAIESALPGSVLGVNELVPMTNGLSREVDINLGDLFIQVKSGNARGLVGQIPKTEATTGIKTIGYAPSMPTAAWVSAARQGVPIARNIDELIAIIKEFR